MEKKYSVVLWQSGASLEYHENLTRKELDTLISDYCSEMGWDSSDAEECILIFEGGVKQTDFEVTNSVRLK